MMDKWRSILVRAARGLRTNNPEDDTACRGWMREIGLPSDITSWQVDNDGVAERMLEIVDSLTDTSTVVNWLIVDPLDALRLAGILLVDYRTCNHPQIMPFIENVVASHGEVIAGLSLAQATYERIVDPHIDTRRRISALESEIATLKAQVTG